MSEERDDQSKWVWAFLLGLIVGALLVVGVGGGLFMVQARRASMAAEEAAMEAERARVMAEEERLRAEEQAARARQEVEKARKELERRDKGGK
jgi:F0F1-type ATP synthase epsilon subunit